MEGGGGGGGGGEGGGKRRILGEVQVEVDLSALNITRVRVPNKKLPDIIGSGGGSGSGRSLKEQCNLTTQRLVQKEQELENLKARMERRSTMVEKMEVEKGKMMGELKQTYLEKEQLQTLLDEELDVRKMIQVDSERLVMEIKAAYERKLNKLRDEVDMREEMVGIKEGLITELETNVEGLKKQVVHLQEEIREGREKRVSEVQSSSVGKDRLEAKLRECQEQVGRKEEEIDEKNREISTLKREIRKLKDACAVVREQEGKLKEKEEQIATANQEISSLRKEVSELQTGTATMHDREQELKKYKEEIVVLNQRVLSLERGISALQGNSKVTRNREDELKKKEEELTALNRKVVSLRDVEDQLKAKEEQLAVANRRITLMRDREDELKRTKEELASANRKIAELQDYEEELKKKEDQLVSAIQKITSLQTNVSLLKEASTVLDSQLRDFESAFTQKQTELQTSEQQRAQLVTECSSLRENLQKVKTELNEAVSMKAFFERRLKDAEYDVKRQQEIYSNENCSLSTKIETVSTKNSELLSTCSKLTAELEASTSEHESLKSRYETLRQDNYQMTQVIHQYLAMIYELKHEVGELKEVVQQTEAKAAADMSELKKIHATAIQSKDASNIQMQCTINQQNKLINFLQDQNESLNKKKRFNLFSRGGKDTPNNPTPTPSKGTTLVRSVELSTPSATPQRPLHEAQKGPSALVLQKCEETELLKELKALKDDQPEECMEELSKQEPENKVDEQNDCVQKTLLLKETTQKLEVNCGFHIVDDLYLLGCDQGLYSRKSTDSSVSVVRIDGMSSVYQMEFISSLNSVLFIEGPQQQLLLASMGIVRSCAEAAACSRPRIKGTVVSDIRNCHMFKVMDGNRDDLIVCATTQKYVHVLSWKNSRLVLRQKISTPEVVTSMVMSPYSVIYGAGKVYELDTKNFEVQEFLDETDPTLQFVIFASDDLTIPMAILDVSMSNWTPETPMKREYLICFPTMGVFIDDDGHRSRGEDITWTKFPQSINYRHPNLYIFHHTSIEVIRLGPDSYTTSRIGMDAANVGKDVAVIPPSTFVPLPIPQFLGKGARSGSIIVGSKDKHNIQVFDIGIQPPSGTPAAKDGVPSSSPTSSSAFSISFGDSESLC